MDNIVMDRAWYIVQTYANCENKVKYNIDRRTESLNMQDYIFQVFVPEIIEKKENKKTGEFKDIVFKPYPGYVFIDMIVTNETWFMVRNTPMVTGFLGSSGGGAKPVPLLPGEMEVIFKECGVAKTKVFAGHVGDMVQILGGPFLGQKGSIDMIDEEKGLVKVLIDLFGGRKTPTEVSFEEVKLL